MQTSRGSAAVRLRPPAALILVSIVIFQFVAAAHRTDSNPRFGDRAGGWTDACMARPGVIACTPLRSGGSHRPTRDGVQFDIGHSARACLCGPSVSGQALLSRHAVGGRRPESKVASASFDGFLHGVICRQCVRGNRSCCRCCGCGIETRGGRDETGQGSRRRLAEDTGIASSINLVTERIRPHTE
jgi:hypothetical protein